MAERVLRRAAWPVLTTWIPSSGGAREETVTSCDEGLESFSASPWLAQNSMKAEGRSMHLLQDIVVLLVRRP